MSGIEIVVKHLLTSTVLHHVAIAFQTFVAFVPFMLLSQLMRARAARERTHNTSSELVLDALRVMILQKSSRWRDESEARRFRVLLAIVLVVIHNN